MLQIPNFVMIRRKKLALMATIFLIAKIIENKEENYLETRNSIKISQNFSKFLQEFMTKYSFLIFKGQNVAPLCQKQIMITIVNYNL